MAENNLDKEQLEELFHSLQHIVWKNSHLIKINFWTMDDYQQEGRLVLYQLLEDGVTQEKLFCHFKVRYKQRLIDIKRRERAFKRGFDCGAGLDIYEYSDALKGKATSPEYNLISVTLLEEVHQSLSLRYRNLLENHLSGVELHRMEKYRLKEKIKRILYEEE
ncbi:hypothetical protein [Lactococcus garvieae]|jgi:competence protein ComX|uniref:ComX n=1 Tax=Lactococcus garvieae DCC43 TaxID=1231377 RepID=K2PJQ0_9LACT|nr:hypothetical protein [Lactococcus garvieae]EKF50454.1 ComX [Lactococcus garvieae DCC43]